MQTLKDDSMYEDEYKPTPEEIEEYHRELEEKEMERAVRANQKTCSNYGDFQR